MYKPGVILLDTNNEDLHLHISLFVYAKSVLKTFKKSNQSFEMRKQILAKLLHVLLKLEEKLKRN